MSITTNRSSFGFIVTRWALRGLFVENGGGGYDLRFVGQISFRLSSSSFMVFFVRQILQRAAELAAFLSRSGDQVADTIVLTLVNSRAPSSPNSRP